MAHEARTHGQVDHQQAVVPARQPAKGAACPGTKEVHAALRDDTCQGEQDSCGSRGGGGGGQVEGGGGGNEARGEGAAAGVEGCMCVYGVGEGDGWGGEMRPGGGQLRKNCAGIS